MVLNPTRHTVGKISLKRKFGRTIEDNLKPPLIWISSVDGFTTYTISLENERIHPGLGSKSGIFFHTNPIFALWPSICPSCRTSLHVVGHHPQRRKETATIRVSGFNGSLDSFRQLSRELRDKIWALRSASESWNVLKTLKIMGMFTYQLGASRTLGIINSSFMELPSSQNLREGKKDTYTTSTSLWQSWR